MTTDRELLEMALEALEYEAQKGNDNAYEKERSAIRTALSRKALDELAEIDRELGLDHVHPDLAKVGEVGVWGEQEHKYWCASLTQMLASLPPKPAPCDCKPIIKTEIGKDKLNEPVAMRWDFDGYGYRYIDAGSGSNWQTRVKDAEPLYTHPPKQETKATFDCSAPIVMTPHPAFVKREWQGLTKEEIVELIKPAMRYYGYNPDHAVLTSGAGFVGLANAIEAKLKEKNQ